jgi:hypothetical protein
MDTKDTRRAVVVVNYGEEEETAEVRVQGAEGHAVEISEPFAADRKATLPAHLRLQPYRCAVVVLP